MRVMGAHAVDDLGHMTCGCTTMPRGGDFVLSQGVFLTLVFKPGITKRALYYGDALGREERRLGDAKRAAA